MGWGLKVLSAVGPSIWPKGKSEPKGSEKGATRLTNKKQGEVLASGAEGTVFDRARSIQHSAEGRVSKKVFSFAQ